MDSDEKPLEKKKICKNLFGFVYFLGGGYVMGYYCYFRTMDCDEETNYNWSWTYMVLIVIDYIMFQSGKCLLSILIHLFFKLSGNNSCFERWIQRILSILFLYNTRPLKNFEEEMKN